ncbi:pancreatic lipase-related protein 2-like isoform X2 [Periplaneta americana]|uniref:pancreatic lipase-related protein 2-like isoform X2 n=1 Tax=Periplaneta americana TaxID=6978 RepID=UPI0037E7C9FD
MYAGNRTSKEEIPEGVVIPSNIKLIEQFGFSCEHNTKFIIHDFTSSGYAGWIKQMVTRLLIDGDWNIFAVDWEAGARPPYPQAASNARVVALEIVRVIKILQRNYSVDVNDIHLIGHGMGAHIAGYVGGCIPGIGKITALDPNGPYYKGMPPCARLDASDANIVEVIHTDTVETIGETGQGISDPIGHFNFYPNEGYSQPGCEESTYYPHFLQLTADSLPPGQILPGCSHRRAIKYIVDAMKFKDCQFLGIRCPSKEAFVNGECTTCGPNSVDCVPMDINNKLYPKTEHGIKLFFKTNSSSPFCLYPYNIIMELTNETHSEEIMGSIRMLLEEAERRIDLNFIVPWPQKFEQGKLKHFLAYHSAPKITWIDSCEVTWDAVDKGVVQNVIPNINVSSIYVTSLGDYPITNDTFRFCSCDGRPFVQVRSGQPQVFVNCGPQSMTDLSLHSMPTENTTSS